MKRAVQFLLVGLACLLVYVVASAATGDSNSEWLDVLLVFLAVGVVGVAVFLVLTVRAVWRWSRT